jgi:hypothetical protein
MLRGNQRPSDSNTSCAPSKRFTGRVSTGVDDAVSPNGQAGIDIHDLASGFAPPRPPSVA